MRRRLAALVALLALLLPSPAAARTTLPLLPSTIRVNVTPHGLGRAIVASTGTLVVRTADGKDIYRGTQRLMFRTNVRRAEGTELGLAPAPDVVTRELRRERLDAIRDLRATLELARTQAGIVLVPFEITALAGRTDAPGDAVFTAAKLEPVTFSSEDGLLTLNGRTYRGTLATALDDASDAIVVNTVPTAQYLTSVVGSEVPSSWEPEALAAQAIAARTYLYSRLARHVSYDVETDTRDQQYNGVAGETPQTRTAVASTTGLVATYRGAVIEAYYSANAGGITEDSENVFGDAQPYLRSVASPADVIALQTSWAASGYEWDEEVGAADLGAQLREKGLDVGLPLRIDILSVTAAGRVTAARVVGTRATRDIGRDRARYYFDLRSALFTVTVHEQGEPEWVAADDVVRIAQLRELGAQRTRGVYEHIVDEDGRHHGIRYTQWLYVVPARFEFNGKGFGHGVGMSQWGAQGMAVEGATAAQILKHYYTGIDLTSVGGG